MNAVGSTGSMTNLSNINFSLVTTYNGWEWGSRFVLTDFFKSIKGLKFLVNFQMIKKVFYQPREGYSFCFLIKVKGT